MADLRCLQVGRSGLALIVKTDRPRPKPRLDPSWAQTQAGPGPQLCPDPSRVGAQAGPGPEPGLDPRRARTLWGVAMVIYRLPPLPPTSPCLDDSMHRVLRIRSLTAHLTSALQAGPTNSSIVYYVARSTCSSVCTIGCIDVLIGCLSSAA